MQNVYAYPTRIYAQIKESKKKKKNEMKWKKRSWKRQGKGKEFKE